LTRTKTKINIEQLRLKKKKKNKPKRAEAEAEIMIQPANISEEGKTLIHFLSTKTTKKKKIEKKKIY